MKKKYWFGEWHSTRKSCYNAYIKLRLDVVNNEFEDKDKKGLNGKVYVFQGNEKLMLDYAYDNYLTKNEGYLKIKNLDKKPKAWGIRNLCPGNYPLCFIPHNSTDNKFIDIKKSLVFECFENVKQFTRTLFRRRLNIEGVKDSLDEVCAMCGEIGTDENPLQLDHSSPTFNEICDMYEEEYGPMIVVGYNFSHFNKFHNKYAKYQFLHRKKCHPGKTWEDRRRINVA